MKNGLIRGFCVSILRFVELCNLLIPAYFATFHGLLVATPPGLILRIYVRQNEKSQNQYEENHSVVLL